MGSQDMLQEDVQATDTPVAAAVNVAQQQGDGRLQELLSLKDQVQAVPAEKRYLTDYSRQLYNLIIERDAALRNLNREYSSPNRGLAHANFESTVQPLHEESDKKQAALQATFDQLGESEETVQKEYWARKNDALLAGIRNAQEIYSKNEVRLDAMKDLPDDYIAPNDKAYGTTAGMIRAELTGEMEKINEWLQKAEGSIAHELQGGERNAPRASFYSFYYDGKMGRPAHLQ
ncbi:MAG: hypothetical protein A2542_00310 [Parcubacteria group bacterium RIFOXYD2_FULL_52_8]|nr:MAG: hypothetical protein A2542_00310 [Parcubacteria group bacterium RIFOXYD2_FULL_52_8]